MGTTIKRQRTITRAEATELAKAHCRQLGARLKESADGVERARGGLIESVLPPFYDWMDTMMAGTGDPGDMALGFADAAAAMLANIAEACSDQPDRYIETVGNFIVKMARKKRAEGPELTIKGGE